MIEFLTGAVCALVGATGASVAWEYRIRAAARLGVRLVIGQNEFSVVEMRSAKR
jgi:hypothetical protein